MKQLRPYQVEAVNNVLTDLRTNKMVAVVMPCGAGKTLCMCHVANEVLKSNSKDSVVIMSHLSILIKQTGAVMKDNYGVGYGILKATEIPKPSDRLVLTTMQSFKSLDKIMMWGGGPTVKLLICDEAHYLGTNSYNNILAKFPNAKVLAVTATPFRKNKLMSNMFDKVSFTISTQEMIDQGYLVPPKLNYIKFDTEDMVVMAKQISSIHRAKLTGHKMIVYLRSIDDCNLIRNLLIDDGIRAESVTSKLVDTARETILDNFKNDTPDSASILLTVDVLTAGFDSPNVRSIVMPYKVNSVVTYLQRVGRGLRTDKDKTYCDVYVGGASPAVIAGYWEKYQKEALSLGKRRVRDESINDRLEYLEMNKELMSKSEIVWTKEVCDSAKLMRKLGLPSLASMVMNMDFPQDLLKFIVACPPPKSKSTLPSTPAQKSFLASVGLPMVERKDEASFLLNRFKQMSGRIQSWETCPTGIHAGKLWNEVPHVYKQIVLRGHDSDIKKSYIEWTKKIRR